jgi:hypothetical protein
MLRSARAASPMHLVVLLALLIGVMVAAVETKAGALGNERVLSAPVKIGVDPGLKATVSFEDVDKQDATFFLLHFSSSLEGSDQLRVELGYDVDVFDAGSGPDFWTRPVGIRPAPGGKIVA